MNTGVVGTRIRSQMQTPPTITAVVVNDELLGFHLEDGRFISVPVAFYPTLALATPQERGRFEINGSSAYWPELDADIGVEGLLAGAREHHHYASRAVERSVHRPALNTASPTQGKKRCHRQRGSTSKKETRPRPSRG